MIVQVKRLANRGTLPPKQVKIPGMLVDFVVIDPNQTQTFFTAHDPAYAGELKVPLSQLATLPFSPRTVIARRASVLLCLTHADFDRELDSADTPSTHDVALPTPALPITAVSSGGCHDRLCSRRNARRPSCFVCGM